jgi:hypothetical protein
MNNVADGSLRIVHNDTNNELLSLMYDIRGWLRVIFYT